MKLMLMLILILMLMAQETQRVVIRRIFEVRTPYILPCLSSWDRGQRALRIFGGSFKKSM